MKISWVTVLLCGIIITSCVTYSHSAEYIVQKGDVLGKIAQTVGYGDRITALALFNGILVQNHVIREGQIIRYVSRHDLINAHLWINDQLAQMSPSHPDHEDFLKIARDLANENFEYDDRKKTGSTFASEILIIADAWEAR